MDLPTDRDGMRAYLYSVRTDLPVDQQAFTRVGDLIRGKYLPSASLAAVFEAAGTIPGVTLVPDAVDAAGRRGIAVARTHEGLRRELIFDPTTYAYLGERDIVVESQDDTPPPGTVVTSTARIRTAVVDRPDQLP